MWSMEVESNGPEGGPLLSRHMKDADDGSLSPERGDRRKMKGLLLSGHMKDADDGSLSPERGDRRKRKGKRSRNFVHKHHMLLRRILKVLTPYYSRRNPNKKRAWFLSMFTLGLLIAESIVLLYFSYAQRSFSTALSHRDDEGFWRGVQNYVVVILCATPIFSLSHFVQQWLILDIRQSLIKCMTSLYFHQENFYRLKCLNVNAPGFRSRMDRVAAVNFVGTENQGGALDTPLNPIDNPDARIVNDCRAFSKNLVDITTALIGKAFTVVMFVVVLMSISRNATFLAVFYSLAVTFLTVSLYSRELTHLSFVMSKRDANFQYGLVRVKEHAEEVAFYHGGERERFRSNNLLEEVVTSNVAYIFTSSKANLLQNWCLWSTSVVPYMIVAGRYLCGSEEFGMVTQTVMAFRTITSGISYIPQNVKKFANLAAETDRLHYLMVVLEDLSCVDTSTGTISAHEDLMWDEETRSPTIVDKLVQRVDSFTRSLSGEKQSHSKHLEKQKSSANGVSYLKLNGVIRQHEKSPTGKSENSGTKAPTFYEEEDRRMGQLVYRPAPPSTAFSVKSLSVYTPDGSKQICSNLSFTLKLGERLLLEGTSGCGKSSLLRYLAGLWRAGSGTIHISSSPNSVMYLPQKPYMPLGSLYDLIIYPEEEHLYKVSEVEQAIADAGLLYIMERNGDLSSVRDWSDELSVGEQQRVGFARLFLARPLLAVLDESTSALELSSEKHLYKQVIKHCSSVVSVGHKSSLYDFHTHVLHYQADEDWRFMTVGEYKKTC